MTVSGAAAGILTRHDGATIAYERLPGREPGLVFLHGLRSDRNGTKALALAEHCRRRGLACLRFDCFGHGDSSGTFEAGTVGRWREDTLAALDELTEGPQILVGSSMGGWLMLLAALARPERVAALVGIAAAPDFTEELLWKHATPEQRQLLAERGRLEFPSPYGPPMVFTRALIEDGRRHLVLGGPIPFTKPVRLLHGQRDAEVPWKMSPMLAETLESPDVAVTLIKSGDHRLSRPEDLAILSATLDTLVERVAG